MVTKRRKFGGDVYNFESRLKTKQEARSLAKSMRKQGALARVVYAKSDSRRPWHVYTRPRSRARMRSRPKTTYKIIRMYRAADKRSRKIKGGLTLAEAQAHCRDPKTSNLKQGWFDAYTKES